MLLIHKSKFGIWGFLVLLSLFFSLCSAYGQEGYTLKGTITDTQNKALAGISVRLIGTNVVTQTDAQGQYELLVPALQGKLSISYLGYVPQTLLLTVGKTTYNAVLQQELRQMDEVVVVGYGTQRKKDITGAVAIVDMDDAKKFSTNDVGSMLQGRVAGVSVSSDGQPGAMPQVRLRGISTFNNADPLYVVDGVPLSGVPRELNPNDIESMQVLKDASAGAIYGSRAANGVIIVTTKKGRQDAPPRVDYSAYYGIDKVWQTMPVTNAYNYQMLNNEARYNANNKPLAPGNDPSSPRFIKDVNTDWQKEGLKSGRRHNQNISLSGGGAHNTYMVSLDLFDNTGTFVGNGPDYKRYTGRANLTQELGRVRLGQTVAYAYSRENALVTGDGILAGGRPPLINDLVFAIPTMPVYDPNRLGGFGGTSSDLHDAISLNGIGFNSLIKNNTTVGRFTSTLWGELDIVRSDKHKLKYKINFGYDINEVRDKTFTPKFNLGYFFINNINRLNDNSRRYENVLLENTLNYEFKQNSHQLSVLVGQMYQKYSVWNRYITGTGFSNEEFDNLQNAAETSARDLSDFNALASYLGRANYNYDDRYLLTATVRRDASSRFRKSNRVGYFPSFAGGWRISNEKFFPQTNDWINDLKIRGSWGKLGNENIGNYLYQAVINPSVVYTFAGQRILGGTQTSVVSEDLKWEDRITSNIGFDARLLRNKLDLSAEYYSSKSQDILVPIPIPFSVGSINQAPIVNAGTLRNSGIEVSFTYHKSSGEFTYDIGANFTTIKNKVLSLGNDIKARVDGHFRTEVGQEVGRHYGFISEGIFKTQEQVDNHPKQFDGAAVGDVIYKDINGDGLINDNDRTDLGSGLPKYQYGFNFNAAFKNFDFALFASGMGKYLINSRLYRDLMHTGGDANYHQDMLDRFTSTNTDTDIPRLNWEDPNRNWENSNRKSWLQDGTYLRINTLSLGYNFPKSMIPYVAKARVYVTAQNLYTFQKYKSYNPDYTYGVFTPGLDNGSYPKPRTILFGVQLGF
ncbi:SusC/RagA family TonB-linked outer membrane protein [Sphingobacterium thalpophilum]|uniref:Outer membrane cobalamin receptor protein n=1 Tax=Sphingobacterium thalpophilum TaxID=259 RepID=A0A4U9UL36_9SPHI|nr:TonB-dependent receptor [Sphingobacterium thalpophilum]VTR34280.1 Outer membrane cobalamin receptor protein [Sphingobacterium thalpophilum]